MTFSLRSLMLVALVVPPLVAGVACCLRELSVPMAILACGFGLLALFAAWDLVRGT